MADRGGSRRPAMPATVTLSRQRAVKTGRRLARKAHTASR